MRNPKVSIIGAGNVGMRYAYSLMIKGIARSILIVDADARRAQGEVMDLCHGLPYISSSVDVNAGDYSDISGSDMVVVTAGRKQKPGQTRMDLAKDNVELFKIIIPQIVSQAPDAIILVVTNPVDVLSYAAYKLSGLPSARVIGSGTVLDSARLRFLLSAHCGIDPRNVHAYILGEHGDSEFAVWSRAMVGGMFLKDYCPFCKKCDRSACLDVIFEQVRGSAYQIIERKGETSYGIGLALCRITEAILNDERAVLPVSTLIDGIYGESGLYMSVPVIVDKNGAGAQLPSGLSSEEEFLFKKSAEAIKKTIHACGLD